MTITAAMVKALRERTGAGMMECKKALTEADGDMDSAVEQLRKKGAAKADQKSGRIAAEGAISSVLDESGTIGVLVEVNCETDFVAKDESFRRFGQRLALTILQQQPQDVTALSAMKLADTRQTVDEARVELFSKVGENLSVRRFAIVQAPQDAQVSAYLHGARIGVLVAVQGGRDDLGRDIAMHVAASRPLCVSRTDVPEHTLAKEREIYSAQAADSGKPQEIVSKIVEGKVQKYINEITLLGQPYVKDPEVSVKQLLHAEHAQVHEFVRYEVGEGLERKEEDFVAEVMAQAKGG